MVAYSAAKGRGVQNITISDFNPYSRTLESIQAKREIPQHSAQVFKKLLKAGKVPNWARKHCDINKIEIAAE